MLQMATGKSAPPCITHAAVSGTSDAIVTDKKRISPRVEYIGLACVNLWTAVLIRVHALTSNTGFNECYNRQITKTASKTAEHHALQV